MRLTLPAAVAAMLVLLAPALAVAKPRVGVGGGLGDPTGPSLKIFFHPQHALQVDFGWAPMHHGDGILHANYLFHFKPFVSNRVMDFGLYLGIGAGVAFWSRYGHFGGHRYGHFGRGRCGDFDDPDCFYYRGHGGAAMIVRAPLGLYFHWVRVPIDTVVEGGWSPYVVYPDLAHGDFSVKVRYYF